MDYYKITVWSLTFSRDVRFLTSTATVIFLSFTTELYHCVCLTRVKPLKLPDLRVSRYRASKTPVESGILIISKVYKRSLSTDRNEVLWHTDTLRMNWVDVSTTRYKRQNASHSYWHPWHRILPRDRQYPWESHPLHIAHRLFRIHNTTWSKSIDRTFCYSRTLREQHRGENRHDWSQNQNFIQLVRT